MHGTRSAAVGTYLRPAFAEEVAEVPAGLHGGSPELFVGRFSITLILAELEKQHHQGPAGMEEVVRLLRQGGTEAHDPVAKRDVKVQGSLVEGAGEVAVEAVVHVIAHLKVDAQDRVCRLVPFLSDVEECLAEGAGQLERR